MITINNTTTNEVDIESMLAVGCIDHNEPGVTTTAGVNYSELTTQQQTIYSDFFALGSDKGWVNINNYDCIIGIDRITSEIVVADTLELDYNTMSVQDKAKVDAFKDLMSEIQTSQENN